MPDVGVMTAMSGPQGRWRRPRSGPRSSTRKSAGILADTSPYVHQHDIWHEPAGRTCGERDSRGSMASRRGRWTWVREMGAGGLRVGGVAGEGSGEWGGPASGAANRPLYGGPVGGLPEQVLQASARPIVPGPRVDLGRPDPNAISERAVTGSIDLGDAVEQGAIQRWELLRRRLLVHIRSMPPARAVRNSPPVLPRVANQRGWWPRSAWLEARISHRGVLRSERRRLRTSRLRASRPR